MVGAIALVWALYISSKDISGSKNGFSRTFLNSLLTEYSSLENKGVKSISGITNHHIYFATGTPGVVYVTNFALSEVDNIDFKINKGRRIGERFMTYVDSPAVFIFAGNEGVLMKSSIKKKEIKEYKLPNTFLRVVPIPGSSLIIRGFDQKPFFTLNQVFLKSNTESGIRNHYERR
jgi:hypothetical protein